MIYSDMPTTAMQAAEIAKQREKENQIRLSKELEQKQYNNDMKRLAQEALDEAKESNVIAKDSRQIAKEGLCIAKTSKNLSVIAIFVSVLAILATLLYA